MKFKSFFLIMIFLSSLFLFGCVDDTDFVDNDFEDDDFEDTEDYSDSNKFSNIYISYESFSMGRLFNGYEFIYEDGRKSLSFKYFNELDDSIEVVPVLPEEFYEDLLKILDDYDFTSLENTSSLPQPDDLPIYCDAASFLTIKIDGDTFEDNWIGCGVCDPPKSCEFANKIKNLFRVHSSK